MGVKSFKLTFCAKARPHRPPPPQKWKGKLDEARKAGDALAAAEASDMVVLYDSLQVRGPRSWGV